MEGSLSREASASPIPNFVSPRSKVAQMMADIDNAPTPSPKLVKDYLVQSQRSASFSQSPKIASQLQHGGRLGEHGESASSDIESESDNDVRVPMGKAARRMLGNAETLEQGSINDLSARSPTQTELRLDQADNIDELYYSTPKHHGSGSDTALQTRNPSVSHSPLFVSPGDRHSDDSEDDLPFEPLSKQSRLAKLVAEKRAEREARDLEAEDPENDLSTSSNPSSDLPHEDGDASQDVLNPEIERILSDAARPTRKASKKALLEMERETQRIARQQALAHQMKVRKKFTTSDLFARFNFRQDLQSGVLPAAEGDTTASSALNSDSAETVNRELVSTPPSSPPTPLDRQRALVEKGALSKLLPVRQDSLVTLASLEDEDELPDLPNAFDPKRNLAATGSKAGDTTEPVDERTMPSQVDHRNSIAPVDESSEDDLEIIPNVPSRLSAFDKARTKADRQQARSSAIHSLKQLANLGGDSVQQQRGKRGVPRPLINPRMLEAQLLTRAKGHARAQQLERIAELKAKGIDVQTAEEREREAEDFETLLEKARQEAADLRKAEKAAAKGSAGLDATAPASDDEDEDADYTDNWISGDDADEDLDGDPDGVVDDAAEETDEEEEEDGEESVEEIEEVELDDMREQKEHAGSLDHELPDNQNKFPAVDRDLATPAAARKSRKSRVIIEDDEESETEEQQTALAFNAGDNDDENPFAAFNFGAAKSANWMMSPTQAFNATMQTPTQATQEESMDLLRHLVPPSSSSLPPIQLEFNTEDDSQNNLVLGSQLPESQRVNLQWDTQPPETPLQSLKRGGSNISMETPGWEPTQDDGLPESWQKKRDLQEDEALAPAAEFDTQSTVRLRVSESPEPGSFKPRRQRLVRGRRASTGSSDEDSRSQRIQPDKKDAFREMARMRKEALTTAERAEAEVEMKRMMDEQAEESEDEYAGLGGDDFVAPETEQDREIIDSSHVDVDERALAAHFAEGQRAADEAAANKLYKDLMTGALRRKQANMIDLDEDEDDLAVRRRQMKQREEARKRRLLLQNDNIAGLAEGKQSKGKDAFLKAIADDDNGDDDMLELSDGAEDDTAPATQSDSQSTLPGDARPQPLLEVSGNKRRMETAPEERPPAKQRRTQASVFRAPTSLLEVKQSVSFLLDEPAVIRAEPAALELSSDSENEQPVDDEEEDNTDALQEELRRQNDGGFAEDRTSMPPPRLPATQRRTAPRTAVVDRLSMKRTSSASESALGRTAWAAPAGGGFKIPSLLRRATTNTAVNANERGVSTTTSLSRENSGVKMGGSKKSSLAYQARAEERKAIVEASAKRRAENTARIAQLRRGSSESLGRGLSGQFE